MKQKKNKTNQVVMWPTATLFSLQELHRLNPKFVEITLRVRLTKAIEAGTVAEVGCIPGEKGRPRKVFSSTPITKITLDRARSERINLADGVEKLIHVVSVTNQKPQTAITPTSPLGNCNGVAAITR
jgi:hypothetical protein